jgi:hypothetical protein
MGSERWPAELELLDQHKGLNVTGPQAEQEEGFQGLYELVMSD